ncbi:MAG: hypothetical protein R3349_12350, partial [Geminicoccaceae bacterium]|nr:hypothetical protein [Geminicoccaceae bacterium]
MRLDALLEPEAPPASLDARFSLNGSGVRPATADARLSLEGRFAGWNAGATDIVAIRAGLAGGRLDIERAALRLATLDLTARGDWRFVEPTAGGIQYELSIRALQPWAPYLPAAGDQAEGSLRAAGTVAGTFDVPRLTGTLAADGLRYGGWTADGGELTYELALTDSLPRVLAEGSASGLVTPTLGSYERVALEIDMEPPGFSLQLEANQPGGGVVQVEAEGRMPPGSERDLVLRRALVDVGEERWALAAPATIRWQDGDVVVDLLSIGNVDGPGLLSLQGQVLPLSEADLAFRMEALPLGDLQRLLAREPLVTGSLWSSGRIRTQDDVPTFDLDFRVEEATGANIRVSSLTGTAAFDGRRLDLDADGTVADPGGSFDIDAIIPLDVALADSIDIGIGEAGAVDGRIRFDRLPLAIVERLSTEVEDAQGFISGDIQLGGTALDPQLSGQIELSGGALTVLPLDQRYQDIEGVIALQGQRAVFRGIRLRSGGTATITGDVVFDELDRPIADLSMQLDGFRPLGVDDEEDAAAWGTVTM